MGFTAAIRGLRGTPFGRPDRCFLLVFLLCLAVFYGGFAFDYYGRTEGLFDHSGHLIGRDFIVYWTASVATLAGDVAQIYDLDLFHELQQDLVAGSFPLHPWLYPPHALFYSLPLGLLPYLWSYALWSAATFALYLWAVLGRRWATSTSLALVLAPATVVNFLAGQNGFLSAALLIGGLRLLDARPVLAGVLFGLLCFKPQLGLLIPVALVAARLWRPFLSAAATVLAVIAFSLGVFGVETWQTYLEVAGPVQDLVLNRSSGLLVNMMPTPYMAARILELDMTARAAIQAIFSLGAVLGVYVAFRNGTERKLQSAVLLVAVFLVSPYGYSYDMTLLSVAVLWTFEHTSKTGFLPGEKLLMALIWILPILVISANANGLPVSPAILTAFFLLLLARARGRLPAANSAQTAP